MTERNPRGPDGRTDRGADGRTDRGPGVGAPGEGGAALEAAHAASERVTELVQSAFGPATRLGGGHHSRVFRLKDGCVLKVYRHSDGLHRREAENMRFAGLADWVLGVSELHDLELLMLRSFPGAPVNAPEIPAALPGLRAFLRRLHAKRNGQRVDLGPVRRKLERFRESLLARELRPLFDRLETDLDAGRLEADASYCHLDLWCANVLFSPPDRVLVVDWARAGFDDPARDIAILKTGTLDLLSPEAALAAARAVCDDEATAARLPAYLALQTLHDLYWFQRHQPAGFDEAFRNKVPRALEALDH